MILKREHLAVRTWFGVVENLALDILLGTTYIGRSLKSISSLDQKIVPLHSSSVTILGGNRDPHKVSSTLWHKASSDHSREHAANQVEEQITIPPETESPVPVVTSRSKFMTIGRSRRKSQPIDLHPPRVWRGTNTCLILSNLRRLFEEASQFTKAYVHHTRDQAAKDRYSM